MACIRHHVELGGHCDHVEPDDGGDHEVEVFAEDRAVQHPPPVAVPLPIRTLPLLWCHAIQNKAQTQTNAHVLIRVQYWNANKLSDYAGGKHV